MENQSRAARMPVWRGVTGAISLLPFGLPLLYTYPVTGSFKNELLRAATILVAGILAGAVAIRQKLWQRLAPISQWMLGALMLVMCASLLRASNIGDSLTGRHGDYQGLLLQVAAIPIALVAIREAANKHYWLKAVSLMQLVCLLSVLVDIGHVDDGYRLSGLLLHDTGMGIYAAITLGLTLLLAEINEARRVTTSKLYWLLLLIPSLATVLSASRLALLLVVFIFGLYAYQLPNMRKRLGTYALCLLFLTVVLTIFATSTGRLTNAHKLNDGVGYRMTLYTWSLEHTDILPVGVGSVDIARQLRPLPADRIPQSLHDTLYVGYPLWYSHNQWIDVLIAYGALGLGLVVGLFARSLRALFQSLRLHKLHVEALALATIALGILLNVSFSTPSIELWPMFWMALLIPRRDR